MLTQNKLPWSTPVLEEVTGPPTLIAALHYAAGNGWDVFPVPPGTKKSHKDAEHSGGRKWGKTKDLTEIQDDFTHWPEAGVGIPTGVDNGIFVVEADTKAGHGVDGLASIAALEATYGPLPSTLMAASPSGSIHRYFKHPGAGIKVKNSASEIAPAVDVRGDGGMVVAPPTVRPGVGAYRWLNDRPIAEPPQWLLELVIEKPKPKPKDDRPEPPSDDDDEPTVRISPRILQKINKLALANLAAWVPVLFPDAKEKDGAWRVSSEALGRDLQEDLSITTKWIKDFGLHDQGDPQQGRRTPVELVQAWAHRLQLKKGKRPAVLWLAQQLAVDLQGEDFELSDEDIDSINRDYALVLAGDKAAIMKLDASKNLAKS